MEREKLSERVEEIRGPGCEREERGRGREALGIKEEMKVEGRQGQWTAGGGLAQLGLVQICL